MESIYVTKSIRKNGEKSFIKVSNSLAFLIKSSISAVYRDNFSIKELSRPLWLITQGLSQYPRKLFSNEDIEIYRYSYCRLRVKGDELIEFQYQTPYAFNSFDSYRNLLIETIEQARVNINAIEVASYVSSGYDSVACAALASSVGGKLAFSIKKSRDGFDDSGASIALDLGMNAVEFDRRSRKLVSKSFSWGLTNFEILEEDDAHRYEFFVGLNFEDEILSIDYDLKNHIVLTGFNGDKLWALKSPAQNNFARTETSGSSMYEFRLRSGFVHIPIPMLFVQLSDQIFNISNSDEMSHYKLPNTEYNRPIPRRIAEELGVQRSSFGVRKTAASTMVENLDQFRDIYFNMLMDRYE